MPWVQPNWDDTFQELVAFAQDRSMGRDDNPYFHCQHEGCRGAAVTVGALLFCAIDPSHTKLWRTLEAD